MDNKIWISSDLHLCHNKSFLYEPRGFHSVQEMNKKIIENFNEVVAPNDDLYLLGDLLLGGAENLDSGLEMLSWLNGRLHLIRGNHDSDKRWAAYKTLSNVVEMETAMFLRYKKYHLYLSHFPTFCANYDDKGLKHCTISICGHSHTQNPLADIDKGIIFHAEVDSNNCYPWNIEDIVSILKEHYKGQQDIGI